MNRLYADINACGLLLALALTVCCSYAFADNDNHVEDVVIVVHQDNPTQKMTRSQVIDLFMGKYVAFPNGNKAIAVDLASEQVAKQIFYQKLVGRSLASVNAYWSRIRFTGRAKPPIEKSSSEGMVSYIAGNKNAIGYIPESMLTDNLKIVYRFNE